MASFSHFSIPFQAQLLHFCHLEGTFMIENLHSRGNYGKIYTFSPCNSSSKRNFVKTSFQNKTKKCLPFEGPLDTSLPFKMMMIMMMALGGVAVPLIMAPTSNKKRCNHFFSNFESLSSFEVKLQQEKKREKLKNVDYSQRRRHWLQWFAHFRRSSSSEDNYKLFSAKSMKLPPSHPPPPPGLIGVRCGCFCGFFLRSPR